MGSSISVQLTGFVGSDVVLKEVGEQRVASFSLAVNRKTSAGKQQTLWVRVNDRNGLAEVAMKYIRKSSLIRCEVAWLRPSAWIDQNGEPRVSLDLDANRIILLDRATTNEQGTEQIPFLWLNKPRPHKRRIARCDAFFMPILNVRNGKQWYTNPIKTKSELTKISRHMKLFISYAHVDKWQVKQLVEILRDAGHDPWFDNKLLPGQDWKQVLRLSIEDCDTFVYALTPESVSSEWCQWEFATAVDLGKSIIPILVQPKTPIPEAISHYQYADFSEGMTPQAVAKLMGGLTHIAISIPEKDAPPAPANPAGKPARAE